jgi:hypothetical protein
MSVAWEKEGEKKRKRANVLLVGHDLLIEAFSANRRE